MNRRFDILSGIILLLLTSGCLHSCLKDDLDNEIPDRKTIVQQGRYLAASNAEAVAALEDPDKTAWFPVGTPYRLLAFTKQYSAENAYDATPAAHSRFNKVAWEGTTPDSLRFINIESEPDKWFGFSALEKEPGYPGGLVSLDFYGFTYGKPAAATSDYITLDDITPGGGTLDNLKHTEIIPDGGELKDLFRGELLNQNTSTAGMYSSTATQSIMPFKHCFSLLHFMVVQQPKTVAGDDGRTREVPCFDSIYVDKVDLTGTYSQGAVYLRDGKVELSGGQKPHTLKFKDSYKGDVPTTQLDMGETIVFPSDGESLKNYAKESGYIIGLEITVKSPHKNTIERFLVNTGSPLSLRYEAKDGMWYGTVVKDTIVNSYTNTALHFKRNTKYTLIISFQEDAVRIITVIPQIEEWLNGEGTPDDPWQDQPMGQPQMFDNIVWSDRNLGADHYDPAAVIEGSDESGFEMSSGYFYQAGRNIPYYPFNPANWTATGGIPDYDTINKQNLKDKNTAWGGGGSPYKLFPIVDKKILRINKDTNGMVGNWIIYSGTPQMKIPETMPPEGTYFNFMGNDGLDDSDSKNMRWDLGQENQPISGAWVVPSRKDFLTIFPSTPHAGNIVFNKGGDNKIPMDWGIDGTKNPDYRISGTKTLRVTVPYYIADMVEDNIVSWNKRSNKYYCDAWRTLHDFVDKDGNKDPGTTHIEEYTFDKFGGGKPGTWNNVDSEPNGDPEDGYASVYVLSIDGEENEVSLTRKELLDKLIVKSWGTIYAIKRVYTPQAYRMRWRVLIADEGKENPSLYIEICRYRCNADDMLTEDNYMTDYDWEHPAARLYFPICGLGDHTGQYINFGTECQYATSEPIKDNKTTAVQIKITGNNASNAYIAVVNGQINRHFGMQIRPVMGGGRF